MDDSKRSTTLHDAQVFTPSSNYEQGEEEDLTSSCCSASSIVEGASSSSSCCCCGSTTSGRLDFLPGVDDFDVPVELTTWPEKSSRSMRRGGCKEQAKDDNEGYYNTNNKREQRDDINCIDDDDDDSFCTLSTKDSTELLSYQFYAWELEGERNNEYHAYNGYLPEQDGPFVSHPATLSPCDSFESRDDSYFTQGFICVGDLPRVY